MTPEVVELLVNAAATGSPVQWPGGVADFTVVGTFGGSTVTLQYLGPDEATWVTAGTTTTLTAVGNGTVYLPTGPVRALVAGGTPSGLYASLNGVIN